MFRIALLAFTLCVVAGAQADSPPLLVSRESPIETSVVLTALPISVPSKINARGCSSCRPQLLDVTSATRFFIRHEQVELDELRALAIGDVSMGVFYLSETNEVTRIVLFRDRPKREQRDR